MHNTWLWFHILAGGIAASFGYWFFGKVQNEVDKRHITFLVIFVCAIGWEVLEYSMGIQAYGNDLKRFCIDAYQDVSGALLMALIVLFRPK